MAETILSLENLTINPKDQELKFKKKNTPTATDFLFCDLSLDEQILLERAKEDVENKNFSSHKKIMRLLSM